MVRCDVDDGALLDRPVRRNLTVGTCRFEVHEAMVDGDRVAARMTIHVRDRRGGGSPPR